MTDNVRRDELLNAISARINQYNATEDPRSVVEGAAAREAEELLSLVPDVERDIDVCYIAGGLYWCRWGVLGGGQNTPDFTRTIDLMINVHREWPEKVPRMLAELFDRGGFTTGALRAGAASKEGNRLFEEYQRTGNRAVLDQAVVHLREAAHSPHTDPERTVYNAMGFALALHQIVQLDGDPDVAAELISWLYSVLSKDLPNAPSFMGLLVSSLTYRFSATRDVATLDEAVSVGRRLFDATQDPLLRGTVCTTAGIWLQYIGNPALARHVAELAVACLASVPHDHRDRAAHVHSVFIGLVATLDNVPELAEHAVQLCAESTSDDQVHWSAVDSLATHLGKRFRATDRKEDVDTAIALGRKVTTARPDVVYRNNLAAWLLERFQLTHDIADLHEAVELLRDAVAASPADAGLVMNLGRALELKYHRTGEFAALDEARALYQRAASL